MSMPPPQAPKSKSNSPNTSAKRSPNLKPTAPNSLMADLALPSALHKSSDDKAPAPAKAAHPHFAEGDLEEQIPVEPVVLAEALSKLESLRTSAAPSAATSPVASGASSPNHPGIPSVTERIAMDKSSSVPGTPHFGAQTDL